MDEKRAIFKNIVFLSSKKIFILLINFIYVFIIANYLGPQNYGLFNYFSSFVIALVALAGTLLFQDIVGTFTPKIKSRSLFNKSIKWQYFIAVPVFFVVLLFFNPIAQLIGKPNQDILLIASPFILLMPLYTTYLYLFTGFKKFGKLLKIGVIENSTNLLFAVLFVIILNQGIYGAFYAKFISIMISILLFKTFFKELNFKSDKFDMGSIKKYIKQSIPFNLTKAFWDPAIILFMGLFISAGLLGIYYMVEKVMMYLIEIPKNVISEAVFPYAAERFNNLNLLGNYVSKNIKLSFIIVSGFSIIAIPLTYIIMTLFFNQYLEGYYLIYLFIIYFMVNSLSPLASVYRIVNRMDLLSKAQFFSFVTLIISGILFIPLFKLVGLLLTLITAHAVWNAFLWYYLKETKTPVDLALKKSDLAYFYATFKEIIWKNT